MKNKALSIAISCASGSGIGTLLALQMHALWLLGVLIGGIVGYLIYDLPAVFKAIPRAYQYAKEHVNFTVSKQTRIVLKKEFFAFTKSIAIAVIPSSLYLGCIYLSFIYSMPGLGFACVFGGIFPLIVMIVFSHGLLDAHYGDSYNYEKKYINDSLMNFAQVAWAFKASRRSKSAAFLSAIFLSPLATLFMIGKAIVLGIAKILVYLLKLAKLIPPFFWKLFKLIHSDLRLLVGIDSLIGGFIGFLFHNIVVGIIAGAVWGFINYYIVSLKILKLKPVH